MRTLSYTLTLLLSSCSTDPSNTKQLATISGSTDLAMLQKLQLYIAQGHKTIIVNSYGGEEKYALEIADTLMKNNISLVVDGACTSACAQYLLVAAPSIEIRPKSIVSMHINSYGLTMGNYINQAYLSKKTDIQNNVTHSKALYDSRRINKNLMIDATKRVLPICYAVVGRNSRVFTAYDIWIPSREYMIRSGFLIKGSWPNTAQEADQLVRLRFKKHVRFVFGEDRQALDFPYYGRCKYKQYQGFIS